MEQTPMTSWPRLTLYVSAVGQPDDDEIELRAVVVTPMRTVLWAESVRGASPEIESWASDRLVSGVLPGAPRLQQLPSVPPDRLSACPSCARTRFAIGTTRSVCSSCDRDEQAPAYAAAMAHRVQADYMTEAPGWTSAPVQGSDHSPTSTSELTLPSPMRAGYTMVHGTLKDAAQLARQSADRTDSQATTSRTTAYGLVLQVTQWLSAPTQVWTQSYDDTVEDHSAPVATGALPWEEFAHLPMAEQQRQLTGLLDMVSQTVQAWGRDPEVPPPALVFHPSAAQPEDLVGVDPSAFALPDAVRHAVFAALLTVGVMSTTPSGAVERVPMLPAIGTTLDEVALQRIPALRVIGSDQALVEAIKTALHERGVSIATAFRPKDPNLIGTLSIASTNGTYTIEMRDPHQRVLLQATIDRTGSQVALATPSSGRPSLPPAGDGPSAVTVEGALDQWVTDLVVQLPVSTTRTVAVGPMTWPTDAPGFGRITSADGVRKAFVARLKKHGYTVQSSGTGSVPVILGGLWDRGRGSEAFLWIVQPSGMVQPVSTVTLPLPGWVTAAMPGPEGALGTWAATLSQSATELSTALHAAGVTEVGLPLSILDAEDQPVPAQAETLKRLAWPSLIRELHRAGMAVYLPGIGHSPDVQLLMQVDWQVVTPTSGAPRVSDVLVTWGLDLVHPPAGLQAGSWTARLTWPRQVPTVESVGQLPSWPLVVPAGWTESRESGVPGIVPMPSRRAFPVDHLEADEAEAAAQRDAWLKQEVQSGKRGAAQMATESTGRLSSAHRRATNDLKRAWKASPSQAVPQQIREQTEEMRRFRRQLPGGEQLEDWERQFKVQERDRPYPRG